MYFAKYRKSVYYTVRSGEEGRGRGEGGRERGRGRAENRKTGFKNLEPAPAVPTDRYI
jgi:hypothetical protein